jgi:predicted deacylase
MNRPIGTTTSMSIRKMENVLNLIILLLGIFLIAHLPGAHAKKSSSSRKSASSICVDEFFSQYHSSSDLFAFIDACSERYSTTIHSIGKSAEGKHLKIVTMGNGPTEIFVMAGLHGREWIAPAATVYAMHKLLKASSEGDAAITEFLAKTKLHFLALVNPDGYDYSRTKSETQDRRQWRKNRRLLPCKGDRCAHGVDLNRNWGIEGRTFGFGATRPTSDVFQGKRPFSEPEIKAIRDWLLEQGRGKKIDFVLDIHCCAQTILPPSYYHDESQSLKAEHLQIAKHVANAMTAVNQEQYGFREREQEFSATNSGISVDWIYGEGGVGLALIVETRGNEKTRKLENIFDVDSKQIGPIGNEVLSAIIAVSKESLSARLSKHEQLMTPQNPQPNSDKLTYGSSQTVHEEAPLAEIVTTAPWREVKQQYQQPYRVDEDEAVEDNIVEEALAPLIVANGDEPDNDGGPPPPGENEESFSLEDNSEIPIPDAPIPDSPIFDEENVMPPPELDDNPQKEELAQHSLRPPKLTMNAFADPLTDEIPSFSDNVETVSDEEDDSSHIESYHEKQTPDGLQNEPEGDNDDVAVDEKGLAETDDELDEEIQVILDEVKLEKPANVDPIKHVDDALSTILPDINESPKEGSNNKIGREPEEIELSVNIHEGKKVIRHDEGLLIVEDEEEEQESEALARQLRNRINQLRAIRKANLPSKWTAFKYKLRQGRWKGPVAFAIAVFLLWHFATRKARNIRRDD